MSRRGENIRKRKDGRWEGRYLVYDNKKQKMVYHSVYAPSYNAVKQKLASAKELVSLLSQQNMIENKILLGQVAEEWLRMIEKTKKRSTYIKYQNIYKKYIQSFWEQNCITELDSKVINSHLKYMIKENVLSSSMQRSICSTLNGIFCYAEQFYNIPAIKLSFHIQKKLNHSIKVLNQAEQIKLIQNLYAEMDSSKLGIILCMSTGLRLGEICSLKWSDIDFHTKTLHVNTTVQRISVEGMKTKTILLEASPKSVFSKREIPLSEDINQLLLKWYKNGNYIINCEKPMEPRTYERRFQKYLEKAGIEKKNFHVLRHTFATNCIHSGTDIKSLSEILGHADVKITLNRYVHPSMETKRQHLNALSSIYGQYMGQNL